MEEQELQEVAPIPVPYNDVRTEQQEFDYELFSEFFKKYNTTQEEKEKLNKSILEYFKSDEFKKYKEEHTIDKEDKENIKSIKENLEFIVSDIKSKNIVEEKKARTYSETSETLFSSIDNIKENTHNTMLILFSIIVALVFAWIFKLIWSTLNNYF